MFYCVVVSEFFMVAILNDLPLLSHEMMKHGSRAHTSCIMSALYEGKLLYTSITSCQLAFNSSHSMSYILSYSL